MNLLGITKDPNPYVSYETCSRIALDGKAPEYLNEASKAPWYWIMRNREKIQFDVLKKMIQGWLTSRLLPASQPSNGSFPFTFDSVHRNAPVGACGIYFITFLQRVMYVGKAVNLKGRLVSHLKSGPGGYSAVADRLWGEASLDTPMPRNTASCKTIYDDLICLITMSLAIDLRFHFKRIEKGKHDLEEVRAIRKFDPEWNTQYRA